MIIATITTGTYEHAALSPLYCIISYNPHNCPGGKYHCARVQMCRWGAHLRKLINVTRSAQLVRGRGCLALELGP